MVRPKKQWKPKIINLRKVVEDGEEKWIEFDPSKYVIPKGHSYYNVLASIIKSKS